ncbi:MAG: hypothetical protein E7591_03340 [Ruminococcaceae bacterium]|nr:hypothetical protein [Oscillospiraceae bacterium]
MKCGAYEMQITPCIGTTLPGYFEFRYADDILDELYAKAVIFDNGELVTGFVALDILHVNARMVEMIRDRFEKLTGIKGTNLMVTGTHTHTGLPMEYNDEFSIVDEDWIKFTCTKAADCAYIAYKHRKDCHIGYGYTEEYELSFNRRFWQKDGVVRTWPGICNPANVKEAGPVDPAIDVLRIDDLDCNPIAVITCFANHLDMIGGTAFSADYPGELSRSLKQALGMEVVSLFLNGFCGDITHIDYNGKHPFGKNGHIKCGRILANDVLSIYDSILCIDTNELGCNSAVKVIDRRQPTKEMYEWGKAYLAGEIEKAEEAIEEGDYEKPSTGDNELMERSYAKCNVNLYENPILNEKVELQVIKVGDVYFNGAPGEIFAELSFDLKEKSANERNVNVELANGCYGYIATKKAFSEGGYEVTLDRYVNMSEDTGDIMVDTLVELQKDL